MRIQAIEYIIKTPGVVGGSARIDGKRLPVYHIIEALVHDGMPPEEYITHQDITLAQVHAALAYYYDNKAEIEAEIALTRQIVDKSSSE